MRAAVVTLLVCNDMIQSSVQRNDVIQSSVQHRSFLLFLVHSYKAAEVNLQLQCIVQPLSDVYELLKALQLLSCKRRIGVS